MPDVMSGTTPSQDSGRWWLRSGPAIGALFCLVAFWNQCYIGVRLAPSHYAAIAPVAVWFGLVSVLMHVLIWVVYAACVGRVVHMASPAYATDTSVTGRDVFRGIGAAQAALLVWALGTAIRLWREGDAVMSEARALELGASIIETRGLAYLASMALLVLVLRVRFNLAAWLALALVILPALVLVGISRGFAALVPVLVAGG